MTVLDKAAQKLRLLANLLENPHAQSQLLRDPRLLRIRRRGGSIGLYLELNKPWLHKLGIGTVLDIGANEGQFASTVSAIFPDAQIYSFEPLPGSFALLQRNMAKAPRFRAMNLALGDEEGEQIIEQQGFTAASSFLPMTDLLKRSFPYVLQRNSTSAKVRVVRLDNLRDSLQIAGELLIKIDVQGFEGRVLRGGEQTVRRARVLIVETSLEPLYEGQPLFDELYRLLVGWGFEYAGALDQICDPSDGRVLQIDSIFVRRS